MAVARPLNGIVVLSDCNTKTLTPNIYDLMFTEMVDKYSITLFLCTLLTLDDTILLWLCFVLDSILLILIKHSLFKHFELLT